MDMAGVPLNDGDTIQAVLELIESSNKNRLRQVVIGHVSSAADAKRVMLAVGSSSLASFE